MIERSRIFDIVTYAVMILGMVIVVAPFWITIVAGSQSRWTRGYRRLGRQRWAIAPSVVGAGLRPACRS